MISLAFVLTLELVSLSVLNYYIYFMDTCLFSAEIYLLALCCSFVMSPFLFGAIFLLSYCFCYAVLWIFFNF